MNQQTDEMKLQTDGLRVIGYNSAGLGILLWPEHEQHTPILVCRNDIVETDAGPAAVTSVHSGVTVRVLEVQS
jgi:hypothetical protein